MFTGIVEGIGSVREIERRGGAVYLLLKVGELADGVQVGDSISVNGCCLTVTSASQGSGATLGFEAVPETLSHTSLGDRKVGDRVNLERALRADARLDGHIVQGHVDDSGVVQALEREGEDVTLTISCSLDLSELLVSKGSVAVDGVSLTVVEPAGESFRVALIPHTLAVTTLGERKPGDRVNLEADVLGKFVRAQLARLELRKR